MVIPSGICVHPIGSTSCSMVPSHERRKPGTTLQGAWHRMSLELHNTAERCVEIPKSP
ncbi:hypothetical protein DPMN_006444 [Dreissena polymorpha]|uniref:Uncharacterized protein n=1 Tax=Dreissena polymorpha TaxID=45954 RepID=A0A9D4MVG0_DREPO|nr:hypothetical protein DPMN_006444 [Dreissena polymorpha]